MEAIYSSETSVLTKSHTTSSYNQKTEFFIVTTVKTRNLTFLSCMGRVLIESDILDEAKAHQLYLHVNG
jgi:hypothetical protein